MGEEVGGERGKQYILNIYFEQVRNRSEKHENKVKRDYYVANLCQNKENFQQPKNKHWRCGLVRVRYWGEGREGGEGRRRRDQHHSEIATESRTERNDEVSPFLSSC